MTTAPCQKFLGNCYTDQTSGLGAFQNTLQSTLKNCSSNSKFNQLMKYCALNSCATLSPYYNPKKCEECATNAINISKCDTTGGYNDCMNCASNYTSNGGDDAGLYNNCLACQGSPLDNPHSPISWPMWIGIGAGSLALLILLIVLIIFIKRRYYKN